MTNGVKRELEPSCDLIIVHSFPYQCSKSKHETNDLASISDTTSRKGVKRKSERIKEGQIPTYDVPPRTPSPISTTLARSSERRRSSLTTPLTSPLLYRSSVRMIERWDALFVGSKSLGDPQPQKMTSSPVLTVSKNTPSWWKLTKEVTAIRGYVDKLEVSIPDIIKALKSNSGTMSPILKETNESIDEMRSLINELDLDLKAKTDEYRDYRFPTTAISDRRAFRWSEIDDQIKEIDITKPGWKKLRRSTKYKGYGTESVLDMGEKIIKAMHELDDMTKCIQDCKTCGRSRYNDGIYDDPEREDSEMDDEEASNKRFRH